MRLDKYMAKKNKEYSRNQLAEWIKEGLILVNGKKVKSSYKVTDKDNIEFNPPPPKTTELVGEDMDLEVIWEDKYIAIIYKEANIIVHPAPGVYSGTLVNGLIHHFKDELSIEGGIKRPGIVHRLDKDTTGLMIIAKDDKVHRLLSKSLQERRIVRKYLALVHGVFPNKKEGEINQAIGRSRSDSGKMTIGGRAQREALTYYRVVEEFERVSLVECELYTGRTHQIRVHMRSIGHPIVGDPLYGIKKDFNLPYQMLHAYHLSFTHPILKEKMVFEESPRGEFIRFLERIKKMK